MNKFLSLALYISIGLYNVNATNLITNSGFEQDSYSPTGKPDYYHYRSSTEQYHQIETSSANVYDGSYCALFNNTSGSELECYYYSNYTANGTVLNAANAEAGKYELTVKYKTDSAFSGNGIKIQILLYEDSNLISISESEFKTSTSWDTLKLTATAKGRVNKIIGTICYKGQGKAWADNLELEKIDNILNASFEIDSTSPTGKPDFYKYRSNTSSYHQVEDSLNYTYLGKKAAKFDNTSGSVAGCYYYGPYSSDGLTSQYISVCPGDSYTFSGLGRVDSSFSGSGVKLSLIFWNGTSYVSRSDSSYINSTSWADISVNGTVPAGANLMSYSVEYSGINEGWVDEIQLESNNLVKNSCYETDSASAIDEPDYWLARGATSSYHHVETNTANVYEGSQCAMFNAPSSSSCYFYGPAKEGGLSVEKLKVNAGETYDFSAWGKVDSNFSGNGIRVSLIFWNGDSYVSRTDSSYQTPADWTKISVQGVVPSGADQMSYSIEYSGANKAWFDKAECYESDSPWYYKKASATSIESLDFNAPTKVSLSNMIAEFTSHHNTFEAAYNGDGSWGVGYGASANNHPLIRTTANAVLGYLYASKVISNSTYITRAEEGLDWLLSEQLPSGSFPWYISDPPLIDDFNSLYVAGLAGVALTEGYRYFQDQDYLNASNDVCDYFLTLDPVYNANFNAFAMWALLENYKETSNSNYLDKAIEFMDVMLIGQLDSGMWSDYHNQYIHYHSIITRALAIAVEVLPDSNPKKSVAKYALFKAINNTRRRQYSNGTIEGHPFDISLRYDPHTIIAFSIANELQGIDLSDSLDTLSYTAIGLTPEVVQGYGIAAVGYLIGLYY